VQRVSSGGAGGKHHSVKEEYIDPIYNKVVTSALENGHDADDIRSA
jgi:hypothetical protein